MDIEPIKQKKNKNDYILILLISLSVLLLIYSVIYLFNYYSNNDILIYFPENINSEGKKLNPNEIGDSIGGILNPIIGFTASILTFLAFYIQFKANKEQREFFYIGLEKEKNNFKAQKEEEKSKEIKNHISNIRILKILIESMINYYTETGKNLYSFIEKEKEKPLNMNIFGFVTNSSYENFQKLDFKDLYNSILYSFENSDELWEKDFTNFLTTIDFYEKLINEIKIKYEHHVKTKSANLNAVGEKLNAKIGDVLINPKLNILDGVDDYLAIVYNRTPNNEPIIPDEEFGGTDIGKLQDVFFSKFIKSLKIAYDETQEEIYKENLEFFSFTNKSIGFEKFQASNYVDNLQQKYDSYFSENNESLKSVKKFVNKINIS